MVETIFKRIEAGDFFLIAGPCVIESESLCLKVAEHVARLTSKWDIPFIFKSSYTKANRLSKDSYTGPGIDQGLKVLEKVRREFGLPVLTDIHETAEISDTAAVVDVLQIPAFLCRQTELVAQAGATGRWVNIKKGQFLVPEDMARIADKANSRKVMLTERGTTFGYRNLVVDFRSFTIMKETGFPVVFDVTHSLQLLGAGKGVSGGQPEFVIPLAKAAMAIGINGLFVETHSNPAQAKSDAGAMLPLKQMESLLEAIMPIYEISRSHVKN